MVFKRTMIYSPYTPYSIYFRMAVESNSPELLLGRTLRALGSWDGCADFETLLPVLKLCCCYHRILKSRGWVT